jgi:hypothetical protein
MSDLNKYALQLACEVFKKTNSGKLPDNMVELMNQAITEKGPVQRVSVRDILCSEIPLPFMPDLIDYKIGKGCCDAIMKRDGLFLPCSNHCEGNKCTKHVKEFEVYQENVYGDYKDRYAAWEKKELYVVENPAATYTEKPYGAYLHAKKLDSTAVYEELAKWGISIDMDPALFRNPKPKPVRKARGRKAELKVEDTETSASDDAKQASDSELEDPSDDENDKFSSRKDSEGKEESDGKDESEDPKSDPDESKPLPKSKPKPKPKAKKAIGTPLDGELDKEPMEKAPEKAPKKGKFKGKQENLKDAEHDGTTYKSYAGKYYDPETLELVAWTNNGVFTLI